MDLETLTDNMSLYVYDRGDVDPRKLNNMFFQFLGKLPNVYPTSEVVESMKRAAEAWGCYQEADNDA